MNPRFVEIPGEKKCIQLAYFDGFEVDEDGNGDALLVGYHKYSAKTQDTVIIYQGTHENCAKAFDKLLHAINRGDKVIRSNGKNGKSNGKATKPKDPPPQEQPTEQSAEQPAETGDDIPI